MTDSTDVSANENIDTNEHISPNDQDKPKSESTVKKVFSFMLRYWWIFLIIFIIIVVVSFIKSASNSPFWDLFKNLFGFADTAAAAVSDILGKCVGNPLNFINPASGCFVAYIAIGGAIYGAFRIAGFFSKSNNALIEQNKKLTNRDGYEVARDFKNKYKQELEDLNDDALTDKKVKDAVAEKMLINDSINTITKSINDSGLSAADKESAKAELIKNSDISRESANNELSEDEQRESDERADELTPIEEPVK